mmetsp:Transcript_10991/g.15259  ORF Transcript_10991/g.15259 Transcript_10991/m.15259 type:complete len:229 (-) Transcript_10991:136-822(-)
MQQLKPKEIVPSLQYGGINEFLNDNPLWQALCSTSNSWSLLSAVVTKINQRLARSSFKSQYSSSSDPAVNNVTVDPKNLVKVLDTVGKEILKMHGIWYHSFGSKYQPILCINPVYGRARLIKAREIVASNTGAMAPSTSTASPYSSELLEVMINLPTMCTCRCSCKAGEKSNTIKDEEEAAQKKVEKYFGSHDYNAGRHGQTSSRHHASCAAWEPPSTGHLHSWRRGY